jgi:hypothetical protein
MKLNEAGADNPGPERLRRFFEPLAASVSAVALHLEMASRRVSMKEDPSEPLATARRELSKVFDLFERQRTELLSSREETRKRVTP